MKAAMHSQQQSSQPSKMKVAMVVGFYMVAAIVMVFVNKAVLNSSPTLPLLMLLLQFSIAVVCLHVGAYFTPRIEIPRKLLSAQKFKQLLPILLTSVIGLTFNTFCLRDVDASFFQIARGLVLPLTITVQALERRAYPTIPVLIAGTAVTAGFFVGVAPKPASAADANKTAAPIMSLVWGVLSSVMTAVHAVLIKRSLPYVDNSAIQLAYWTNSFGAVALLPFVLLDGEAATVWTSLGFEDPLISAAGSDATPAIWDWQTFLIGSLVTGVVGFLLCIAGLLSIKITSPVTHMFSSACRSVLQTVLGVWVFHDIISANRLTSIFTILGGSMYYTWIKSKEAGEKPKSTSTSDDPRRGLSIDEEIEEGLLMNQYSSSDSVTLFEVADASDDEDEKVMDEEKGRAAG